MRYPDFLKDNGTIGFIAPSFGCATDPYKTLFESAQNAFTKMGYNVILGPNCYAMDGEGKSTTPQKCGQEVNDFFINDKSDVIISCGGGETMCEDLPYIDFAAIAKAKPKWYAGYSDNTNLTFTLNTLCDTASIYGPCVSAFGSSPMHESVVDELDILRGRKSSVSNYKIWYRDDPDYIDESEEVDIKKRYEQGQIKNPYKHYIYNGNTEVGNLDFSGRLLGGCMDCLDNLIGTPYDKVKEFNHRYSNDGVIWFLEACDFNVMDIRRSLWHMKAAGWFDCAKGFLFGRPLQFDDTFGDFDHYRAVLGILDEFKVPIVMDTDIGHLFPAMPIISGAMADVKATKEQISIDYRLV